MTEELKLPPLPEGLVLTGPGEVLYIGAVPADTRSAFTAEQMREYARWAILTERERLALQWDGCMCDAVGGEIDVGAAIRSGQ